MHLSCVHLSRGQTERKQGKVIWIKQELITWQHAGKKKKHFGSKKAFGALLKHAKDIWKQRSSSALGLQQRPVCAGGVTIACPTGGHPPSSLGTARPGSTAHSSQTLLFARFNLTWLIWTELVGCFQCPKAALSGE